MNKNSNLNDGLKDVTEKEFKDKFKEYSNRVKKGKNVIIPNEPIGSINIPKPADE